MKRSEMLDEIKDYFEYVELSAKRSPLTNAEDMLKIIEKRMLPPERRTFDLRTRTWEPENEN